MGDVVNMSARLMGKAARNTVLCDSSTAKEAENVFSFKEAMRIKVCYGSARKVFRGVEHESLLEWMKPRDRSHLSRRVSVN